jgi:hypothetical protein
MSLPRVYVRVCVDWLWCDGFMLTMAASRGYHPGQARAPLAVIPQTQSRASLPVHAPAHALPVSSYQNRTLSSSASAVAAPNRPLSAPALPTVMFALPPTHTPTPQPSRTQVHMGPPIGSPPSSTTQSVAPEECVPLAVIKAEVASV